MLTCLDMFSHVAKNWTDTNYYYGSVATLVHFNLLRSEISAGVPGLQYAVRKVVYSESMPCIAVLSQLRNFV